MRFDTSMGRFGLLLIPTIEKPGPVFGTAPDRQAIPPTWLYWYLTLGKVHYH